jgi:hypothetical protein
MYYVGKVAFLLGEWIEFVAVQSPQLATCTLFATFWNPHATYITNYLLHVHNIHAVFLNFFWFFDSVSSSVVVPEVPVWVLVFVARHKGWSLIGPLEVAVHGSPERALVYTYYVWKVLHQENENWSVPQMSIGECHFFAEWWMPQGWKLKGVVSVLRVPIMLAYLATEWKFKDYLRISKMFLGHQSLDKHWN